MNPDTRCGFASRLIVIVLAVPMLTPNASAEWKEKVLYSFQGGSDGATPAGGVVFDKAGNLYGATSRGNGTVFELTPGSGGAWTESTLYAFQGKQFNDGPGARCPRFAPRFWALTWVRKWSGVTVLRAETGVRFPHGGWPSLDTLTLQTREDVQAV